jgi:hypothetical protein
MEQPEYKTVVRHRVFVLSKGTKIAASVLLGLPLVLSLLASIGPHGVDLKFAGFALAVFGLPILLAWRAPTPYSNRSYKVVRVKPPVGSAQSVDASHDTSEPFLAVEPTPLIDNSDDYRTNPMYSHLTGNIWHDSCDD